MAQRLQDHAARAVVAFPSSNNGVRMLKIAVHHASLLVIALVDGNENMKSEGKFFEKGKRIIVFVVITNKIRKHIQKVTHVVVFGDRLDDQASYVLTFPRKKQLNTVRIQQTFVTPK